MTHVKILVETIGEKADDREIRKCSIFEILTVVIMAFAFTHVHFLYFGDLPLIWKVVWELVYVISSVCYYLVVPGFVKFVSSKH